MRAHQTDFSHGSVKNNILPVMLPMMVAQLLNLPNFIGGAACFITMCATVLPELRIDKGRTL